MRTAIAFTLLCTCCTSSSSTTTSLPDAATTPDAAIPLSTWERVQQHFGTLETIAGKREVGTDGVNSWLPAFENGPALDAELSRPHIAMADAAGNVFIADKDAHAIHKVDPEGRITTVAGTHAPGDDGDGPGDARMMRLSQPNGLWVQPDGTLFILDLGNSKVRRVTPDGTMATVVRVTTGIALGRGLWVNSDSTRILICSGTRVLEWTAAGLRTFATGFAGLGNLVEDQGRILVADRDGNAVYSVDPEGNSTRIAGNGTNSGGGDGAPALETALEGVRGVWPFEGGFFVATHEGSQVWFVDDAGVIHLFLDGEKDAWAGDGEPWSTPGKKLSEVRAITIDPAGNLLITESDEGAIRRVRAN